jgi:hypothetical protein
LIGASVLIFMGFQGFLLGLLADLIARNRRISEDISYRIRKAGVSDDPGGPARFDTWFRTNRGQKAGRRR